MFNKIWKVYKEKSKRLCQTVREYIIVKSRGKKNKTQQYNLLSHQLQHHCQKQMGKEIKDKMQISWVLKQCNCSHN